MNQITASNDLLVLEYGGTARSGKGTLVGHLAESYEGVATEETGADYRAITRSLLMEDVLEPDMSPEHVAREVQKIGTSALTGMVANRNELVADIGLPSLYQPDVTDLVGHVSPLPEVRKAVKAGFTKRVEAVRDNDDYGVLLVDGRNLAPVVEAIPGTQLLMRTFVSCLETEAAIRECFRKGLQPHDEAWAQTFSAAYSSILARNKLDAGRSVDPVRPDDDSIDYWMDSEGMTASAELEHLEKSSGHDGTTHLLDWLMEKPHHMQQLRRGIGSIACRDNRQIHFDTGFYRGHFDDPRGGMLTAARAMFEEALGIDHMANLITQRIPLRDMNYGRLGSLSTGLRETIMSMVK